jgi:threonine dehydrogenase-like Zn-dependent dehydrogenase
MQAVRVEQPHQLQIVEVPNPVPAPGEVLIKVHRTGICGSDMHIYHGANPFACYPRIIGHEFMGEIAAVAADVGDITTGQRVVIDPVVSYRGLFPQVLDALAQQRIDGEALITHEFDFRAAAEAMQLMENHPGQTCKIQLTFD